MYIIHSCLSCKFAITIQLFQVSFFHVKMVNDCEGYVHFQDI